MSTRHRTQTLDLLAHEGLIYVCVDEPQGFVASMPPIVAATADPVVIRMHGRNPARWRDRSHGRRSGSWAYRYSQAELAEWAEQIQAIADHEVHVIFSNGPVTNAVANARELVDVLDHCSGAASVGWPPPRSVQICSTIFQPSGSRR